MISETGEWKKEWLKNMQGKILKKHSQIETRDPYCDAKGRQDWWASIRRWGAQPGGEVAKTQQ